MDIPSDSAITRELTGPSGEHLTCHATDCIQGMKNLLPPGSVDVLVTSPPYNLGIDYNTYKDTAPRKEYLAWMDLWAGAVKPVISPGGSVFLNMGGTPRDPWVPIQVAEVLQRHLTLQNVIHWIKSIYIEQTSTNTPVTVNVGHFKPINSKRFVNDTHEYIFHFTHTGNVPLDRLAVGVPYKDGSNIQRWNSAGGGIRCRGNVWYIPYETIQNRRRDRPHPATFPPKLAEMCIRLHGLDRVRSVLDPFMGLGSTALACANLGVNFTGFELDPEYFREAVQRIAEATETSPDGQLNFSFC